MNARKGTSLDAAVVAARHGERLSVAAIRAAVEELRHLRHEAAFKAQTDEDVQEGQRRGFVAGIEEARNRIESLGADGEYVLHIGPSGCVDRRQGDNGVVPRGGGWDVDSLRMGERVMRQRAINALREDHVNETQQDAGALQRSKR